MALKKKTQFFVAVFVIAAIAIIFLSSQLIDTVPKGSYHVIQWPVSGTMMGKMEPGTYVKFFSDRQMWPNSETFFFTADDDEGEKRDQSIEVRFNDGSVARISGTLRVLMPRAASQAIDITTKHNFKNYNELEQRFILPIVRNALRLTANLMNARESYAERRADFISMAWDQIVSGTYKTIDMEREVEDLVTGKITRRMFKVIATDSSGVSIRESNPLKGTGIGLSNFEVKSFVYDDVVRGQISKQQENLMAIAEAATAAQKAEQIAKTKEAEGKAQVMQVRYEQLMLKEQAVIEAQQIKEVAETHANKDLQVAKLQRLAAVETKQQQILLGQGEAERKRLVLNADGALAQKLSTYENVMEKAFAAWAARSVPAYYISAGGSGAGGTGLSGFDAQNAQFMTTMNTLMAKMLGLDMTIPKGRGIAGTGK